MPSLVSQRLGRVLLVSAGVAAIATSAAAAAVGSPAAAPSPSGSSSAAASPTVTPTPSASATRQGVPSGTATAAGVTKVKTHTGPMGRYLSYDGGRALYMFLADTPNKSNCTGECAAVWPPLLTALVPIAGSGLDGTKMGTTMRPDGTKQITYNGHPLYLYAPDKHGGETLGQGLTNFGARWWLVNLDGNPIT